MKFPIVYLGSVLLAILLVHIAFLLTSCQTPSERVLGHDDPAWNDGWRTGYYEGVTTQHRKP